MNMIIAVDFDGTIVEHKYPDVGPPIPGAIEWLKKFQNAGCKIILWTMRCHKSADGDMLTPAVEYLKSNGIELYGVNSNPSQVWSKSPKAYAHCYIDDTAIGCPLKDSTRMGARPMVDWDAVGPMVEDIINKA